ncbi:MAG: phosphatidate cytidylyltransferase, partial [Lachnospiraceae bacterium]|nr:phosphatidate cytidylyltransferase [Lachnospiraceae bacterium]
VYGLILKNYTTAFANPVPVCMIIGGIGALVSMIGDLAASAIKRNYDIKDYGRLIPGHGGILDRFDSVIFVAPIIYYLCDFIM